MNASNVELSTAGRMFYRSGEKSSWGAAVASIIPGLGHAYAGSWAKAILIFFLVGPLAWGLVFGAGARFHSGLAFLAVLAAFYGAIMWDATGAAARKNEERLAIAMTMADASG
jgi:hypothetical protein